MHSHLSPEPQFDQPPLSATIRLLRQIWSFALPIVASIVSMFVLQLWSCGDDAPVDSEGADLELTVVSGVPETSTAGTEVQALVVAVRFTADGAPAAGVEVTVERLRGGGSVNGANGANGIVTGTDGMASIRWTLGESPVRNTLALRVGDANTGSALELTTLAVRESPAVAEDFGDVNGFLDTLGRDGSTEDLTFDSQGRLVFGIPQGLAVITPQGSIEEWALTGDQIVSPLGVAAGAQDSLWIADAGANALLQVSAQGVVSTVLTTDGEQALEGPNYVAVAPNGDLLLTDPCLGELIRLDVSDSTSPVVLEVMQFDLQTEGGPNGTAFDSAGEHLYLLTENTGLLCSNPEVGLTDPLAGLFEISINADGSFGERRAVVEGFGLFGDGLAFDSEGNLYMIFDRAEGLSLSESAVWVLPAGETELTQLARLEERVFANLAFGTGDYGATTLYLAMLAVPPFTAASTRGLMRLDLGISGQPL